MRDGGREKMERQLDRIFIRSDVIRFVGPEKYLYGTQGRLYTVFLTGCLRGLRKEPFRFMRISGVCPKRTMLLLERTVK